MADSKISDLPAVTDVVSGDEYVLARSGATKAIDADDLAAGIAALYPPSDASSVGITDTGGYFTATDVEGALQEIGAAGSGGANELAYATRTSNLSVTATTEAGSNTVVTAGSVTLDGSTRIRVEFVAATVDCSQFCVLTLWGDDGGGAVDLGIMANVSSGSGNPAFSVKGEVYLTPTANTWTFSIRAYRGTGTANVYAGSGGVAGYFPAFIRIIEA